MQLQLQALRRGVDVVVATPGRVLDHVRRKSINLAAVRMVVLDEADEMLDMGFAEDLDAILTALPRERQTALFSATIAPRIATIAKTHLRNPVNVTIAREASATGKKPRVREIAYVVPRQHKIETLGRVLDMEGATAALVFCRTRHEVDELSEALGARGYVAEPLHGGLSQEQRDRVMRRFRDGTTQLLIATDVAARQFRHPVVARCIHPQNRANRARGKGRRRHHAAGTEGGATAQKHRAGRQEEDLGRERAHRR
jgi:ATP-dependent RNA helicase DeaD